MSTRKSLSRSQDDLVAAWVQFKEHGSAAARDFIIEHYRYLISKTRQRIIPTVPTKIAPEDLEQEGLIALIKAGDQFEPSRGVPWPAFLRMRVLTGVWTRRRQESGYARHCGPEAALIECKDGAGNPTADDPVRDDLRGVLAHLAEPDRWLIEHVYWDGVTEAALANSLGITQSQYFPES